MRRAAQSEHARSPRTELPLVSVEMSGSKQIQRILLNSAKLKLLSKKLSILKIY